MPELTMADYRGAVTKCTCTNPEEPANCNRCFARGYLAACLACRGTGQTETNIAGTSGMMKATCNPCGGKKFFAVNKPENFEAVSAALTERETVVTAPSES